VRKEFLPMNKLLPTFFSTQADRLWKAGYKVKASAFVEEFPGWLFLVRGWESL